MSIHPLENVYFIDKGQPLSLQLSTMVHYMRQALVELADQETALRAELEKSEATIRSQQTTILALNDRLARFEWPQPEAYRGDDDERI